jgi:hypothetical protein
MKGRGKALGFGIAVAAGLIAPAGAGAATVTVGSPLSGSFVTASANSTGTTAMVAGPNIVSPVDGTVVNWRTQGFTGTLRLRVLRLEGGFAATATATAPPVTLTGGTTDQSINVPISKGEVVGFDNTQGPDTAQLRPSPAYTSAGWVPPLPDNGSPRPPTFAMGNLEFAYNATIRYCVVPSIVGQNLGPASQALTAADCSLGSVTKKKRKKGTKKLKGPKIVKSQSVPPGTALGDQAPVDVHVKVKPKKPKKK